MGYPIYKLLRAVNRQYPNNGFINYVDVREDTYDNTEDQMIDEDLRDLINETIQEVYKDVAIDEVYSFPTVPGQNQYVLPEDCDLRDIQEVTRTYQGFRGPLPRPFGPEPGPGPEPEYVAAYFDANGGTGEMDPISVPVGTTITLPACTFTPPADKVFRFWQDSAGFNWAVGTEINMQQNETYSAIWTDNVDPEPVWDYTILFKINPLNGTMTSEEGTMLFGDTIAYSLTPNDTLPETPTVTPATGLTFDGWSLDGENIVPVETIMETPATQSLTYIGLFSSTNPLGGGGNEPNPEYDDIDPEVVWEDPSNPPDPVVDPDPETPVDPGDNPLG